MNAKARTARQIIKGRRQATKAHAAGQHTLKSHCLRAGLDAKTAGGVAGALRTKAKVTGVRGVQAHMMRRAEEGMVPVRGARRYSREEFLTLAHAYRPVAPQYKAAKAALIAV